jgi:hypothetical protein
MVKNKIIHFAIGIGVFILLPFTAQSATDLKFTEGHFSYSEEALADARKKVEIVDFNLSMDKTDAEVLFNKDPRDKSTFPVDFIINGKKFLGRIKAFGSSTSALKKKSIILKLTSGRWHGYKKISLSSMASDGSMMRVWMAWELMRNTGVMVPDTYYVRLNINGEFIGYFLYIEWLGKHFLERNGYNASSEFYQATDRTHCGDFRHGSNLEHCWTKLSPRGGDYSSLKTLAEQIKSTPADKFDQFISENFEDDSLTRWLVSNTLVSQGDTYNKNYFLLKSGKTGKWKVIPWDYDLTFGQSYDAYAKFPKTLFNEHFQYYYPLPGVFNPMKAKALLNKKLKARYLTQLKHLIGKEKNGPEKTFGWFSPTVMNARINNLAAVLRPGQANQKYGARSDKSFVEQYDAVAHYGIVRPFFLETKMLSPFDWVWSYNKSIQMVEYKAYLLGKDLFPEDILKAEAAAAKSALNTKSKEPAPLGLPLSGRVVSTDSGKSLIVHDPGYGYFLVRLDLKEPYKIADFQAEVDGQRSPMYLFDLKEGDVNHCIYRSWLLFTRIPSLNIKADVTFEYFDENSQLNELGNVKNEHALNLWVHTGKIWKPLVTEVNQKSNTLTVRDFMINAGKLHHFVACYSKKPEIWSKPVSR